MSSLAQDYVCIQIWHRVASFLGAIGGVMCFLLVFLLMTLLFFYRFLSHGIYSTCFRTSDLGLCHGYVFLILDKDGLLALLVGLVRLRCADIWEGTNPIQFSRHVLHLAVES